MQPNTKTFTALIGSVGKMNTQDQAMEIIDELLSRDVDSPNLTQTYSALMSACEKAGQWDLAVTLFDKMSAQVWDCLPVGTSSFLWRHLTDRSDMHERTLPLLRLLQVSR